MSLKPGLPLHPPRISEQHVYYCTWHLLFVLEYEQWSRHQPVCWTLSHTRAAGEETVVAPEEGQCGLMALNEFTQ